MMLEQYLKDREEWQDRTIEHIREKILFKPKTDMKSLNSEKLVAIYGPPQIGKTTLILFLMGIDLKYQKKVYDTLRAGVPRGNSSTSTAIIYQKSETEEYGIKYGDDTSEIEYCSEETLKQKIQTLRKKVEGEKLETEIIHIYIPFIFFDVDCENGLGINVVDLPGVDSRNIKEKAHVDTIINKYMALATINIITCKANEINSLSEIELPINVDWKNYPHKYIVVITNAYGQGTIKKYFNINKSDRALPFLDYVINEYSSDLKKIINPMSQIEFFPIDIGDSFESLTKRNGLNEEDCREVVLTTYKMADEIRNSIQKRHGNGLKSTIMDLKAYSLKYAEQRSIELSKQIEEKEKQIEVLKSIIECKAIIVKEAETKLDEIKDEYDAFLKLKLREVVVDVSIKCNEIVEAIKKEGKKEKFRAKDLEILDVVRDCLYEFIKTELLKYDIEGAEEHKKLIYQKIQNDIGLEDELIYKYYRGGLFAKKIKKEEMIQSIKSLLKLFEIRFTDIIQSSLDRKISEKKDVEMEYQQFHQWKDESRKDIKCNQNKIEQLSIQVKSLKGEIDEITLRKDEDARLINDYLKIARDEFCKYKNDLLIKINSDVVSVEEKAIILIYLCLLEKDYKSIIEMR